MKRTNDTARNDNAKNGEGTAEEVIAYRKTCDAEGTGLSHYILMDKKPAGGGE